MDKNAETEPARPPYQDSGTEEQLTRLFRSTTPDAEFTERLERKLEQRAADMARTRRSQVRVVLTGAWRWGLSLAGLAVLVGIIVLVIGTLPQRLSALPAVEMTATPFTTGAQEASGSQSTQAALAVSTPTPQPSPTPLIYRVAPGDSCLSIAARFGVEVGSLMKLNRLSPDCTDLMVDTELTIPVTASPEPGATPYVVSRMADVPVNLRSGPGTEHPIVGTISGEDRLPVHSGEPQGEWVPVDYIGAPDGIAWVFSDLVTVIGPPASTPTPAPTLQVSADNPRRDGDDLLVDVCIELPDNEDWMVNESTLHYVDEQGGQHQASLSGGMLLSLETPSAEGAHGQRCDVMEFSLPATGEAISPTLEILSLSAYPREGQTCTAYQTRVQPLLDARHTGITIACTEDPHGSNMSIAVLPEGLSEQDALAVVYQTFMEAISIQGPWSFELSGMAGPEGIPDLEMQQPVLAELRALDELRFASYYPHPGWLHMRARELYQESMGSLPDGSPIPLEYIMDYWFYMNEAGLVERSITRMLAASGEQLRVSIFKEGQVTGPAAEESYPQEPYEPGALDYAFTDMAQSGAKRGAQLSRGEMRFEGKYIGEQFVVEDDEVRRESIYDPQTGKQISLMTWRKIPGGTQFFSSVHFEVLEKDVEPPPEVLALLE